MASAARTTSKAGTDPPGGHTLYSQGLKQGHRKCLGMLHPHSDHRSHCVILVYKCARVHMCSPTQTPRALVLEHRGTPEHPPDRVASWPGTEQHIHDRGRTNAAECTAKTRRLGETLATVTSPRARPPPRSRGPGAPPANRHHMLVRCDIPSYTNPSKKPAARYQPHLARPTTGRSPEGGAELCSEGQDSGERAGKHLLGSPDHAALWNHRARRRSLCLGLRHQACASLRWAWVVQAQVAELEGLLGVKD